MKLTDFELEANYETFIFADRQCGCKPGEECVAQILSDAFEAGAKWAKEYLERKRDESLK